MRYESIYVDINKVKRLIRERGMTLTQFCKAVWGENDNRGGNSLARRPNMQIETAMKICNLLDISLDEFFSKTDNENNPPHVVGNQNIVNSSVFSNDPTTLRSEIKSLKILVKEKDARIDDLKQTNQELSNRIDFLLDLMKKK